jgi:hypothetical protein
VLSFPESRFVIALYEAQRAARLHRFSFLSNRDPSEIRSLLRETGEAFSVLVVKIVVSSTSLCLEEAEGNTLSSGVGKPLEQFETFAELGMLGDLEATLRQCIPPLILESISGKSLQLRLREQLLGSVSHVS